MCYCGLSSCNFWHPSTINIKPKSQILTLEEYLHTLISKSSTLAYQKNWPGSHWIKVTFEFIKYNNKYIRESINNEYTKFSIYNLLKSKINDCLDGLLIYKSLMVIKNESFNSCYIRAIDYIILCIKEGIETNN